MDASQAVQTQKMERSLRREHAQQQPDDAERESSLSILWSIVRESGSHLSFPTTATLTSIAAIRTGIGNEIHAMNCLAATLLG